MPDYIAAMAQTFAKIDPEAMADMLWLARFLPVSDSTVQAKEAPVVSPPAPRPQPKVEDQEPAIIEPDQAQEPKPDTAENEHTVATGKERPDSSLFQVSPDSTTNQTKKGLPLKVPAASALPNSLELGRSLRPFNRRVSSRRARTLDIEETVNKSAEARFLWPQEKPAMVRWLEVALVFDDSPGMAVWRETAIEFRRLLERQGAFRDVRTWRLADDGTLRPGLSPNRNSLKPVAGRSARELFDPSGRRLVLVLTDCVPKPWWDGGMGDWLNKVAQVNPLAIVQMLPSRLWLRTALGEERRWLSSGRPGSLNHQLRVESDRTDSEGDDEATLLEGPPIPVLGLEARSLRQYAGMFVNGANSVRGVVGSDLRPHLADEDSAPTLSQDADSLVKEVREDSPMAYELARCFAAIPLSLPVMRLVQRNMLSQSTPADLAEFLLSGLVARLEGSDDYEFREFGADDKKSSVRDVLIQKAPAGLLFEVLEHVSQYLEKYLGIRGGFDALVEHELGTEPLPAGARPFAEIREQVLMAKGLLARSPVGGVRPAEVTLPGRSIWDAAWSPDGQWLAVGGVGGVFRIDEATRQWRALGLTVDAASLVFGGPSHLWVISMTGWAWQWLNEEMIMLRSTGSVALLARFRGEILEIHKGYGLVQLRSLPVETSPPEIQKNATAIATSQNAIALGLRYGGIAIYLYGDGDAPTSSHVGGLGRSTITSLAWSPDGTRLAAISADGLLQIYTSEGNHVTALEHEVHNRTLSFSEDGRLLAATQADRILLWRTDLWTQVDTIPLAGNGAESGARFHPHEPTLAAWVGGGDTVHYLDVDIERLCRPFEGAAFIVGTNEPLATRVSDILVRLGWSVDVIPGELTASGLEARALDATRGGDTLLYLGSIGSYNVRWHGELREKAPRPDRLLIIDPSWGEAEGSPNNELEKLEKVLRAGAFGIRTPVLRLLTNPQELEREFVSFDYGIPFRNQPELAGAHIQLWAGPEEEDVLIKLLEAGGARVVTDRGSMNLSCVTLASLASLRDSLLIGRRYVLFQPDLDPLLTEGPFTCTNDLTMVPALLAKEIREWREEQIGPTMWFPDGTQLAVATKGHSLRILRFESGELKIDETRTVEEPVQAFYWQSGTGLDWVDARGFRNVKGGPFEAIPQPRGSEIESVVGEVGSDGLIGQLLVNIFPRDRVTSILLEHGYEVLGTVGGGVVSLAQYDRNQTFNLDARIVAILPTRNPSWFLAATENGRIVALSIDGKSEEAFPDVHLSAIRRAAISPDRATLLLEDDERSHLIEVETGTLIQFEPEGFHAMVDRILAFHPSEPLVVAGVDGNTQPKLFPIASYRDLAPLSGDDWRGQGVKERPFGKLVALEGCSLSGGAWAPDGHEFVVAGGKRIARIGADGAIAYHEAIVGEAKAISRGPQRMAVGADLGGPMFLRPGDGEWTAPSETLHSRIEDIAVAGPMIVVCSRIDGTIVFRSWERAYRSNAPGAICVAAHPNCIDFAVGYEDGELFDSREKSAIQAHPAPINAVTWNRAGTLLATAGSDKVVRVVGETVHVLPHQDVVIGLSFRSDDRVLATLESGGTVRIWSCDDWREVESFAIERAGLYGGVSFHPELPVLATFAEGSSQVDFRWIETDPKLPPLDRPVTGLRALVLDFGSEYVYSERDRKLVAATLRNRGFTVSDYSHLATDELHRLLRTAVSGCARDDLLLLHIIGFGSGQDEGDRLYIVTPDGQYNLHDLADILAENPYLRVVVSLDAGLTGFIKAVAELLPTCAVLGIDLEESDVFEYGVFSYAFAQAVNLSERLTLATVLSLLRQMLLEYFGPSHPELVWQPAGLGDLPLEASPLETPTAWRGKRLLWVDDRPRNNRGFIDDLTERGTITTIALDTDQALRFYDKHRFDAVVTDMARPTDPRAGYRLLEELVKRGPMPPCIVFAGSNSREHRRQAVVHGALGSTNNKAQLFWWLELSFTAEPLMMDLVTTQARSWREFLSSDPGSGVEDRLPFLLQWLDRYGSTREAGRVLTAWLLRTEKGQVIEPYIVQWLEEHGKDAMAEELLTALLTISPGTSDLREFCKVFVGSSGVPADLTNFLLTWYGKEKDKATRSDLALRIDRLPLRRIFSQAKIDSERLPRAVVNTKNVARLVGEKSERATWRWQIYLDESPAVLEPIRSVKYLLHDTFAIPVRIVTDRASGFALTSEGWGTFEVTLILTFRDGSRMVAHHALSFSGPSKAGSHSI